MENIITNNELSLEILTGIIFIIGSMCGITQYLEFKLNKTEKKLSVSEQFSYFVKYSLSGGLLALGIFLLTDELELKLTTQFGIVIFISFMGYEKLYSIVDKIINKYIERFNTKKDI